MFKTIVQGSSVPQDFIPRLVGLWKRGLFPTEKLTRTYELEVAADITASITRNTATDPKWIYVVFEDIPKPGQRLSATTERVDHARN